MICMCESFPVICRLQFFGAYEWPHGIPWAANHLGVALGETNSLLPEKGHQNYLFGEIKRCKCIVFLGVISRKKIVPEVWVGNIMTPVE